MNADGAARRILEKLGPFGAYLYHRATTGSLYIKFPHSGLGSIRIANHQGRDRYKYRWNVDLTNPERLDTIRDGLVDRLFFGVHRLENFYDYFEAEALVRNIHPIDKDGKQ